MSSKNLPKASKALVQQEQAPEALGSPSELTIRLSYFKPNSQSFYEILTPLLTCLTYGTLVNNRSHTEQDQRAFSRSKELAKRCSEVRLPIGLLSRYLPMRLEVVSPDASISFTAVLPGPVSHGPRTRPQTTRRS